MTVRIMALWCVIGILFFVAIADALAMSKRERRDPIGQVLIEVSDIPLERRIKIANILKEKNRRTDFLGISPEIAPLFYFLNQGGAYICAGTIYNERTVTTAGHCGDDVNQEYGYYVLYFGIHNWELVSDLEQLTLVDDVRLHPGHRYSGAFVLRHDISLLITDRPLNFTTIAVRPLPSLSTRQKDKMALKSNNCVAIGFGVETPEGRLLPDILQEYSPVNFVTNRECHENLWQIEYSATPNMVCSIDKNAGACNGDSGGSIGCYDDDGIFYQVGMTSWSPKPNGRCGEYAHVYTRMSKYRRWIKYYSYRV